MALVSLAKNVPKASSLRRGDVGRRQFRSRHIEAETIPSVYSLRSLLDILGMGKRSHEDDNENHRPSKRLRPSRSDRLSSISHELLLRILSYLPDSDLVRCQRISGYFKALAGDSQLWKGLYYERFVRPRASRIPGVRDLEASAQSLFYSSKSAKWLDDDRLVKRGEATDWKRQYKLRYNWSRGSAKVSETKIARQASTPPLLLALHDDIVITADALTGLKAWALSAKRKPDRHIARIALEDLKPTSLAIDGNYISATGRVRLCIGFDNGNFAIYTLDRNKRVFLLLYQHRLPRQPQTHGVRAIAYLSPYLMILTGLESLSLYRFGRDSDDNTVGAISSPTLLSSLQSRRTYAPFQLQLRASSNIVVASIAYAMPNWRDDWSIAVQELRITEDGSILSSRFASAAEPSALPMFHSKFHISSPQSLSKARSTSISYNHPYLLSANSDNTLTLYMVTSNTEELSIAPGQRLWGHTSSISGAYVCDRGKAVSVSTSGGEIRVWELEGGITSTTSRRRAAAGESSVRVRSAKVTSGSNPITFLQLLAQDVKDMAERNAVSKGWIAFDEEKVVLLREKLPQGAQALVVYDFS